MEECKKNSELVTHMRVHTDERPFVCDVAGCEMKFKQLGTLKVSFFFNLLCFHFVVTFSNIYTCIRIFIKTVKYT